MYQQWYKQTLQHVISDIGMFFGFELEGVFGTHGWSNWTKLKYTYLTVLNWNITIFGATLY